MASSTEHGLKLQLMAVALIAVLVFLHYLLWLSEGGVRQTHTLRIGIQAQREANAELKERNRALAAEIADLKSGLMAIEERARSDMGMIRRDETLYRMLEKPRPPGARPSARVAAPPTKPGSLTAPLPAVKPPALPTARPVPTNKPSPAPTARPAATNKPSVLPTKPATTARPTERP
ncbi:MAG: septum formation initiator family protein [Candidatus Contendobacter sp.]